MRVKENSGKAGLKLNIPKKKKIKGGIISWQIEGKKVDAVTDFLFLCSKITVDGDCSHEIRKAFASWKESYDKLIDSVLKSRDITLPTNVHLVKAIVFPIVMYRCESWTIKKAKC